ncbi:hypothetical protein [Methylobacterium tarhaniae]|uniref:hypothetical protein n=1 Tax=Methylobacterium tarhaniae TaxID=1187852 RepID=UPI00069D7C87|nr:hypothetical protein [Methylobacterium tarhaniae]
MLTEIQVDETKVVARFERVVGDVLREIRAAVDIERLILEALVKRKLSGEVLNVVTGKLRRSIYSYVETEGDRISGVVAQSGDVKYGARWEFGFTGDEVVQAHVRTITQAFGRAIAPREVEVREFTRHVDQPARPFMRPSLAERAAAIVARLKGAAVRGAGA